MKGRKKKSDSSLGESKVSLSAIRLNLMLCIEQIQQKDVVLDLGDVSSDDDIQEVDEEEEGPQIVPKKPDPIELHFEVPVSGGLRDVNVMSDTTHEEVLLQIAKTMGVRVGDVKIYFHLHPKAPSCFQSSLIQQKAGSSSFVTQRHLFKKRRQRTKGKGK